MSFGSYGALGEGNQVSRVYDISQDTIIQTRFSALIYELAASAEKPTSDIRFQWDEVDLTTVQTQVNNVSGYSTVSTTLTVDSSAIFKQYDLIHVPRTKEVMQVTVAPPSSTTVTVQRGVGSTAATLLNDDYLVNIGNAMYSASTPPSENMSDTTTVYNYCSTIRRPWSISGDRLRTNGTPGLRWDNLDERALKQVLRDIEYQMLFGKRSLDSSTYDKERYTMNGLEGIITTNVEDISGTLDEDDWISFLHQTAFRYGGAEKWMFCGPNLTQSLTGFDSIAYRYNVNIGIGSRKGVQVSEYVTPAGQTLNIIQHELLRENPIYAGIGFIIDPMEIKLRTTASALLDAPTDFEYGNGKLKAVMSIQTPGKDGYLSEYFFQGGLELRNEMFHAIIKNVTV